MRTRTTIRGRPLHPMLVTVPLGAFPLSLVLDALHVWTREDAWYAAAFVATAVGAAVLLVAIVPALVDYASSVPRRGRVWKTATVHMALGLSLTGLFAASAAFRWETLGARGEFVAVAVLTFNALGNLGLVAQGYLGGSLVKLHRVGASEGAEDGVGERVHRAPREDA